MVVISVTQASKGMHNKLEYFFFRLLVFVFVCLLCFFVCLFFFLQLKMSIKKNNNLCPETKKQLNK